MRALLYIVRRHYFSEISKVWNSSKVKYMFTDLSRVDGGEREEDEEKPDI